MNKGMLYGFSSIVALMAVKNVKNKGSRNENELCNSCLTGDNQEYSIRELYSIMNECGYYMPQTSQIFEEMISESIEDSPAFGSFAKRRKKPTMKEVLDQAVNAGLVSIKDVDTFLEVYEKDLDKKQKEAVKNLILKLDNKPYQLKILFEIKITTPSTAKSMAELIRSVGSRTFINRYLQRTAFVVSSDISQTNFFKDPDSWKRQWVCDVLNDISEILIGRGLTAQQQFIPQQNLTVGAQQEENLSVAAQKARKQEIENVTNDLELKLNKLGLDLNRDRIDFERTTQGKILRDKPLDNFQKVERLSDIAWFLELAEQCNVQSEHDLFYTFPQENVTTAKVKNFSIFDQVWYKLHIPCTGDQSIQESFPNCSESFGANEIKELIGSHLEIDKNLHKPYVYFYKLDKTNKVNEKVTICFYSYASGSMKQLRTPVFTKTSKMNTISFSIPAGPPQVGGSCLSAATSKMAAKAGFGVNDATYVCQKCYALKNRYQMLDYVFSSAPRMNWITYTIANSIDSDPFRFGKLMSLAIESYARYGYEQGRDSLEIGFIGDGKLKYRSSKTAYSYIGPCNISDNINKVIPQEQRGNFNSQFWIDFSKNNDIAGYFRIHDSGDFSITSKLKFFSYYIRSWGIIANCFPQVKFWAPTRLWNKAYQSEDKLIEQNAGIVINSIKLAKQSLKKALGPQVMNAFRFQKASVQAIGKSSLSKKILTEFQMVCEEAPNLIIRPSGLTVLSPFNNSFIGIPEVYLFDPTYKDIAAGSGVNAVFVKNGKGTDFTASAYRYVSATEAFKVFKKNGGKSTKKAFLSSIKSYISGSFMRKYDVQSFEELPKKSYTTAYSQGQIYGVKRQNPLLNIVQQCPVDAQTDEDGNQVSSSSSCMSSGCRFCWIAKHNCVTYGEH